MPAAPEDYFRVTRGHLSRSEPALLAEVSRLTCSNPPCTHLSACTDVASEFTRTHGGVFEGTFAPLSVRPEHGVSQHANSR